MRAAVLDRVQLAAAVVDADEERRPAATSFDRARAATRPRGATSSSGTYVSSSSSKPRRGSSGSGVPFARCSATLSVVEAEHRALEPDRRERDRRSRSSSSSFGERRDLARGPPLAPSPSASTWPPARSRSRGPRSCTSSIVSPSSREARRRSRPRRRRAGSAPRPRASASSITPWPARVLVVVEDDLAVAAARTRSCEHLPRRACRPSTRRSISSGIVYR